MNTFRNRPNWVDEEPLIQLILNHFVDQLDRNVKPLLRITERSTPELFDNQEDEPEYLWGLVTSLDNEYHVLTIKKQRVKSGHELFENAQLYFNIDKEPQVREWLNRPAFDPYTVTWEDSFQKVHHLFEDNGHALESPLRCEGKTATEILQGFAQLAQEINTAQTLRNLSAKCFWGDSKFLDNKLNLIQKLLPTASHTILPRPVMMNISLPDSFNEVLFIENLDTFLMLQTLAEKDPRFTKTALVYSAGFKGTSSSIRTRGQVIFSALSKPNDAVFNEFEQWWLQKNKAQIRCYFWGDMDYAGLAILAALRKSFNEVTAWQLGYKLMLSFHELGLGHKIRDSKKMKQLDPQFTGCPYSDEVILPLIRSSQRFLDQEVIALRDLQLKVEH